MKIYKITVNDDNNHYSYDVEYGTTKPEVDLSDDIKTLLHNTCKDSTGEITTEQDKHLTNNFKTEGTGKNLTSIVFHFEPTSTGDFTKQLGRGLIDTLKKHASEFGLEQGTYTVTTPTPFFGYYIVTLSQTIGGNSIPAYFIFGSTKNKPNVN